jgi:hypothetical protein
MKKTIATILSLSLMLGVTSELTSAISAKSIKKYQNCTELNKDYQGGVARTKDTVNKGGKVKYKPFVSKELYDANKSKDRDKDFIACEK